MPVIRYTLAEGNCTASVLTYGGILQSLMVPDRDGAPTDVVLGFDTVSLLHWCADRMLC